MYMRHLRGYDKTDPTKVPSMTLEETQIPALCSYIYALPSKGKTAELDHFVRVNIPMLLSIMQMSCSTTTIARVDHLVAIMEKSRKVMCSTRETSDEILLLTFLDPSVKAQRPRREISRCGYQKSS
jgi:hypothetical protein